MRGEGKWRCSDEEEPGYGTLGVSFVMADEYTESVKDEVDGRMRLELGHVDSGVESCDDVSFDIYFDSTSATVDLDMVSEIHLPLGPTCGYTYGDGYVIKYAGYDLICVGYMDPTVVKECTRVDTTITVTCYLQEDPDTDA